MLDYLLPVHLQTCSIRASKYIFKKRRRVNRDTRVTVVERVLGNIYSADPRVDRHHLISISSYHTMKIHTLSFPTFGLTRSVRDFVAACNCMDPQRRVVSYFPTQFATLLEPEPLFLMNFVWMSRDVWRSVDGGLSAF